MLFSDSDFLSIHCSSCKRLSISTPFKFDSSDSLFFFFRFPLFHSCVYFRKTFRKTKGKSEVSWRKISWSDECCLGDSSRQRLGEKLKTRNIVLKHFLIFHDISRVAMQSLIKFTAQLLALHHCKHKQNNFRVHRKWICDTNWREWKLIVAKQQSK